METFVTFGDLKEILDRMKDRRGGDFCDEIDRVLSSLELTMKKAALRESVDKLSKNVKRLAITL